MTDRSQRTNRDSLTSRAHELEAYAFLLKDSRIPSGDSSAAGYGLSEVIKRAKLDPYFALLGKPSSSGRAALFLPTVGSGLNGRRMNYTPLVAYFLRRRTQTQRPRTRRTLGELA